MKDEETIKIGDVVRIKGQFIKMTVEGITSDKKLKCVWFHDLGGNFDGPFRDDFPPQIMERAKD